MDLGVIAMKGYSTLPRGLELEPEHQMHFSVLARTTLLGWSYFSVRDRVRVVETLPTG